MVLFTHKKLLHSSVSAPQDFTDSAAGMCNSRKKWKIPVSRRKRSRMWCTKMFSAVGVVEWYVLFLYSCCAFLLCFDYMTSHIHCFSCGFSLWFDLKSSFFVVDCSRKQFLLWILFKIQLFHGLLTYNFIHDLKKSSLFCGLFWSVYCGVMLISILVCYLFYWL